MVNTFTRIHLGTSDMAFDNRSFCTRRLFESSLLFNKLCTFRYCRGEQHGNNFICYQVLQIEPIHQYFFRSCIHFDCLHHLSWYFNATRNGTMANLILWSCYSMLSISRDAKGLMLFAYLDKIKMVSFGPHWYLFYFLWTSSLPMVWPRSWISLGIWIH